MISYINLWFSTQLFFQHVGHRNLGPVTHVRVELVAVNLHNYGPEFANRTLQKEPKPECLRQLSQHAPPNWFKAIILPAESLFLPEAII